LEHVRLLLGTARSDPLRQSLIGKFVMGDFLLDFRPASERQMAAATEHLLFCEDMQVSLIEEPEFSLLLTSADDAHLWAPFQSAEGDFLVALCGRVAFEEKDWTQAQRTPGKGGLACKAIFNLYRNGGPDALRDLNGNFVVLLLDRVAGQLLMVTDRCGMMLAYAGGSVSESRVFSSHPDALASVTNQGAKWDWTSLAEFLMTGRLTFPHTYYQNIQGLEMGTMFRFGVTNGTLTFQSKVRHSATDFQADRQADADDLAAELADAFRKAVRRRTWPVLGRAGIALSGGLDSRLILSAAANRKELYTFNLFNERNIEFRTAEAIAAACAVEFAPIQRDFDYYGHTAELGVRISGGMGCIASNHFLGVRNHLAQAGIQNLLTGCYCDYLFKGLALNTAERKLTRGETLKPFAIEFYRPCYWLNSPHGEQVRDRLGHLFPESNKPAMTDEDWSSVERKRTFPLAYEGDLAQRVIPQRVMPWYLPTVDNDVIDVYRKIPTRRKLNGAIFKQAAMHACDQKIRRIPDSNTGAPLDAGPLRYAVHRYTSALQNRIHDKLWPHMATRGSWPNWEYYLPHSRVISSLWMRNRRAARDFFLQIAGHDPYATPIREYRGCKVELFLRLLTLKLWLDQRTRAAVLHAGPAQVAPQLA
jgi:asparagine synthase (glutamine-hydrolysing)